MDEMRLKWIQTSLDPFEQKSYEPLLVHSGRAHASSSKDIGFDTREKLDFLLFQIAFNSSVERTNKIASKRCISTCDVKSIKMDACAWGKTGSMSKDWVEIKKLKELKIITSTERPPSRCWCTSAWGFPCCSPWLAWSQRSGAARTSETGWPCFSRHLKISSFGCFLQNSQKERKLQQSRGCGAVGIAAALGIIDLRFESQHWQKNYIVTKKLSVCK